MGKKRDKPDSDATPQPTGMFTTCLFNFEFDKKNVEIFLDCIQE